MKPATPELLTYIQTNRDVVVVDLYTFSLVNQGDHRFIDYPNVESLAIAADRFPGSRLNGSFDSTFYRGPSFARSKITTKIGLEPAELDVTIYGNFDTPNLINGQTWQRLAVQGDFDNATVELNRLFVPVDRSSSVAPDYLDTRLGAIVWFYGKVADVQISRTTVDIKVKSMLNILQEQQMPRRLFQSACTHIFGDAGCGYDRVNGLSATGSATGINQRIVASLEASYPGLLICNPGIITQDWIFGTCTGQSGANGGISRGIAAVFDDGTTTRVGFNRQFPYNIQVNDQFALVPGCAHTVQACQSRNNLLRYGGFPYIPPPETAI